MNNYISGMLVMQLLCLRLDIFFVFFLIHFFFLNTNFCKSLTSFLVKLSFVVKHASQYILTVHNRFYAHLHQYVTSFVQFTNIIIISKIIKMCVCVCMKRYTCTLKELNERM